MTGAQVPWSSIYVLLMSRVLPPVFKFIFDATTPLLYFIICLFLGFKSVFLKEYKFILFALNFFFNVLIYKC
jgi:hypothetical protein